MEAASSEPSPAASPMPRRDFPAFPFIPYPIQSDFMCFLYDSLQLAPSACGSGSVVFLESPTGTGKTLSIICSAMQWLVDQRSHVSPPPPQNCDEEPDWMRDYKAPVVFEKKKRKKHVTDSQRSKETAKSAGAMEFLIMDGDSGDEGDLHNKARSYSLDPNDSSDEEEEDEEFDEVEAKPKVFFTSRTHSQLSQFVKEFRRTSFASQLNLVCLGSRNNLCINPDVFKLGDSNRINERCLELQKQKMNSKMNKIVLHGSGKATCRRSASSGCQMLQKNRQRRSFRDEAHKRGVLDIEDLAELGRTMGACPYYGSRDMVSAADLVVLPYQSLFLRSSRESLGLDLKDSIVIIDEAHNLADSLTSMYNAKISSSQLSRVLGCLETYLDRFLNLLGADNRRHIQTLIMLTKSFLQLLNGTNESYLSKDSARLENTTDNKKLPDNIMTVNGFLFSLNMDNINLVKLCQFLKDSKIIYKVSGYCNSIIESPSSAHLGNPQQSYIESSIIIDFQALIQILFSLTSSNTDGRIIISRRKLAGCTDDGFLKFVMLCGEKIFSEVLDNARAVILVGGTLQPIEETRARLFPCLPLNRVRFFTCNHIVSQESILPVAVPCGPSGLIFDFSYNSRSSPRMIEELGRFVCNIVTVVPQGIVIFFPSYEYEGQVFDVWKESGIIAKLSKKKHVFREPRNSSSVETVLKEYSAVIESCEKPLQENGTNGAVLLAIVGGKISEGINFSDGMGRCIVMVGLPYPNLSDVELAERIKHIEGILVSSDDHEVQSSLDVLRQCKQGGRDYYENLCMKAVNQSIGRAIRHSHDYAAMLLVDSRYAYNRESSSRPKNLSHPSNKLPQWIKQAFVCVESYGQLHRLLHNFFKFNQHKL